MGLFIFTTILFIIVSIAMILIILVQRPQGGGLAGAFGGASGGSTDTVFGGRVGDALTAMTCVAFLLYLGLAIGLNMLDNHTTVVAATQPTPPVTATMPPPTSPGVTPAAPTGSTQIITPSPGGGAPSVTTPVLTPPTGTGSEGEPLPLTPPSTSPSGGSSQ